MSRASTATHRFVAAVVALTPVAVASRASAESPERVTIEVGLGPYSPAAPAVFRDIYGSERGPIANFDASFHVYRIPHVGPIGVGVGLGWARYAAHACLDASCGQRSDESLHYDIYPLGASLHLRVDTLQTEWNIPIFLSAGIGGEYVRYREQKGGTTEARGGTFGLRYRAQIAFVLDILDQRAARALDENHGINHSYLFFELRGATATDAFPVADRLTYAGGLGLVF